MSLTKFQDHVFLDYKQTWFVWESAWESFRPITSVVWTGTTFRVDDSLYCANPSDELYGYGSESMKKVCAALTETYGSRIKDITTSSVPLIGTPIWFYDRHSVLSPCAPRDKASWKRMVQTRGRTCRHAPRGKKFTRRCL